MGMREPREITCPVVAERKAYGGKPAAVKAAAALFLVLLLASLFPASAPGAGGAVMWTVNGVALRDLASSHAWYSGIVPDGSGGAIVAWMDQRSGNWDVYA